MFEELAEISKLRDEYINKLRQDGKKAFEKACVQFFEAHGDEVKTLILKGYTPGFNDGDPCNFTIRDLEIVTHAMTEKELQAARDDEGLDGMELWSIRDKDFKFLKNVETLQNLLHSITDTLEEVFGSNFKLIVSKERVTVEDFYCGY
jgi:hypothetical protein